MLPSDKSRRRQRRLLSRSDEEIEREMDNSGISYRLGWPKLPHLPLNTIPAHTQLENEETCLSTVARILVESSVTFQEAFFAIRAPLWASKQSQAMFLTLVILVDTESNIEMFMHNAIKKIRHYLKTPGMGAEELSIELIDFRAIDDLCSIPLGPQDKDIVEKWPDILDAIIAKLTELHQQWLVIELCYRRLYWDQKRNKPTVMITTPSATEEGWWENVLPTLRSQVDAPFPLEYEVVYGTTLNCTDWRNATSENITSDDYESELTMGSSIGISSLKNHAGTAGGMVTLEEKGSFALTNFHVVTDDRVDASKS